MRGPSELKSFKIPELLLKSIPALNWAPAPSKHNLAAALSAERLQQVLYFLPCGSSITKSSQGFLLPSSQEFPFSALAGACGCHPQGTLPPLPGLVGECCSEFPPCCRCRRLKNLLCTGIGAFLTPENEGFDVLRYFRAANQKTGQIWAGWLFPDPVALHPCAK